MNTYMLTVLLLCALYTVVDLAFALAVMHIPAVRLRYAQGVLASPGHKIPYTIERIREPVAPSEYEPEGNFQRVPGCDCDLCRNP
jgi:hypothetical protein